MYTHASEMFFDVYPFVNSIDGLPSARVSLYKPTGRVTFQGDTYTREEVQDLVAAFNAAFKYAEECLTEGDADSPAGGEIDANTNLRTL